MLAVIIAAVAFLVLNPQTNGLESSSASNSEKPKSMAENVSRFYSEFRASSRDPIKEKYGDYVLPLDEDNRPIEDMLDELSQTNFPDEQNWRGNFKQRAFAQGSTLMSEAQRHISAGGLNLIWALNQDFVIRHRFVTENTLAGMLSEVAGAIDANFVSKVNVYYCENKRTLIISDRNNEYLQNECILFVDNL